MYLKHTCPSHQIFITCCLVFCENSQNILAILLLARCLQQWLDQHNTCPMCKTKVMSLPGERTGLMYAAANSTSAVWDVGHGCCSFHVPDKAMVVGGRFICYNCWCLAHVSHSSVFMDSHSQDIKANSVGYLLCNLQFSLFRAFFSKEKWISVWHTINNRICECAKLLERLNTKYIWPSTSLHSNIAKLHPPIICIPPTYLLILR